MKKGKKKTHIIVSTGNIYIHYFLLCIRRPEFCGMMPVNMTDPSMK